MRNSIKRIKIYSLFAFLIFLNIIAIWGFTKNSEFMSPSKFDERGVFIIRMVDNPKTPVKKNKESLFFHKGGEYLDPNLLFNLVKNTIKDFEINLNNENNTVLIYETLITETLGGQYPYDYAHDNYKNYGIAQFRLETAKFLKGFVKKVSEHDYNLLLSLRVNNKSEKWNLMYNVKYSIALCLIYYFQRDKNIAEKAYHLEHRAKLWKTFYNTNNGLGTPEKYIVRVKKYYKDFKINL